MTLDVTCYDLTKTFRICGVTAQKENGTFVSYTYDGMPVSINVPYTAMDDFTGSTGEFYQITVQADKNLDSQVVADKIVNLLERRHQCAGDDYFQVQSFQDIMKSMNQMLGMVTAFISLLRAFPSGRWYRCYEHHAGVRHRAYQGDRYPEIAELKPRPLCYSSLRRRRS